MGYKLYKYFLIKNIKTKLFVNKEFETRKQAEDFISTDVLDQLKEMESDITDQRFSIIKRYKFFFDA